MSLGNDREGERTVLCLEYLIRCQEGACGTKSLRLLFRTEANRIPTGLHGHDPVAKGHVDATAGAGAVAATPGISRTIASAIFGHSHMLES